MSDIRFNIENFDFILKDCTKAENNVEESTRGFAEITKKLESELSTYCDNGNKAARNIQSQIYEVERLINTVECKSTKAQCKKQQVINRPTKPSIPSNATTEQSNAIMSVYHDKVSQVDAKNAEICKQNQRIDEYISHCLTVRNNLETIIANLRQQMDTLKKEMKHVNSQVRDFLSQLITRVSQCKKINLAMSEFCLVFEQTFQVAQQLDTMTPTSIKNFSYNDKRFEIKNTHNHFSISDDFIFQNSNEQNRKTVSEIKKKKEMKNNSIDELFLKDRDNLSFFENTKNASRIKMPSANLHKLGGKNFILKMNSLGYTTVTQVDGTIIDKNGLIHWKKEN